MLKRNLWLIYPCGYYGSYLNWAIRKSDAADGHNVIDDPILSTGSSHGFLRFPSHQAMDSQIWWLYHSPVRENLIIPIHNDASPDRIAYGINRLDKIFSYIVRLDINPFIVNIHYKDKFYKEVCALNVIDKWMVNLEIHHEYFKNEYNPWTDTDRIRARNYLKNTWEKYFPESEKLDIKNLMTAFLYLKNRLDIRHRAAPMEILYEQYPLPKTFPKNNYEINVDDILSENFVAKFKEKVNYKELGNFDFTYWEKFHNEKFLPAQKVLNWRSIKDNFIKTGEIDSYIESNLLAEALIFAHYGDEYQNLTLNELSLKVKAQN